MLATMKYFMNNEVYYEFHEEGLRMHIITFFATKGGRMIRFSIAAVMSVAMATSAIAENNLTALPPTAERPYPYEILGLQPGDPLDDVMALYAERSERDSTSESEVLRVQSPDGDVGVNGRLAKMDQDQLTSTLSSDIMEQRPMAIHRSIRQPSDDLPEPLELKAQIEETYGPPSRFEINGRDMKLTYVWSMDGFIPDLAALPSAIHEETSATGSVRQTEYELCGNARHYLNEVDYRFEHPRNKEIKPGCLASFTLTYRGEPGSTLIGFSLVDYELGRIHMHELDRQIVEALTGEEVEASDMDL
ncbi:hypothetical protein CLV80_11633 [Yoonia maritima]|uniref:Uncharacterized protein n=2 Tax=Yoonia maritima TaxID=1435347 RepID=A0A2T0VU76_9RHOB|nr:hypothetical protein CLV80_11633 [Yoonia maritima]